jgi:hypothetical protein
VAFAAKVLGCFYLSSTARNAIRLCAGSVTVCVVGMPAPCFQRDFGGVYPFSMRVVEPTPLLNRMAGLLKWRTWHRGQNLCDLSHGQNWFGGKSGSVREVCPHFSSIYHDNDRKCECIQSNDARIQRIARKSKKFRFVPSICRHCACSRTGGWRCFHGARY